MVEVWYPVRHQKGVTGHAVEVDDTLCSSDNERRGEKSANDDRVPCETR